MTYETVVPELIARFPDLRTECRVYMDDGEPLAYVAFGCVLIPLLERALAERNMTAKKEFCEFFESVAIESKNDTCLADLLGIEVGEWLQYAANDEILEPWLGTETKRICGYIPGLATQRRSRSKKNDFTA